MMICKLFGVEVLVLAIFCSAACCIQNEKEPIIIISDLSEIPIRYDHDQLFRKLGFSIRFSSLIGSVGDDLAATKDKDTPNVLANKYSINDLLAMNEVHQSDFTPEKVQSKLDFCESLSPYRVAKRPDSDHVLKLIEANKYFEGSRYKIIDKKEVRKPQEFAYYKNLYDYCLWTFEELVLAARDKFKLDDRLDKKLMKLTNDVGLVYWNNLGRYPGFVMGENPDSVERLLRDFISAKQPDEVADIKATCADLLDRVAFVANRECRGIEAPPIRYITVYRYCNNKAFNGHS